MVRPLVEPGQYVQQTRQQLRRLEGISRQHAQAVIADTLLPPARGSKTRTGHRVSSHNGQHSSPRRAFVECKILPDLISIEIQCVRDIELKCLDFLPCNFASVCRMY